MITSEQAYQMLLDRGYDPNEIQSRVQMPTQYRSRIEATGSPIPPPSRISKWGEGAMEYAPQGVGATIGSLAVPAAVNMLFPPALGLPEEAITAPLGAKIGAGLGRLGGALFGGAGGKGYQQTARMLADSPNAPRGLEEIYDQQAKAALEEGVGELIGMGLGAGISKLRAPMKHKLIPGADIASRRLAEAGTRIPSKELTEETAGHIYKQRRLGPIPLGRKKPGVILTPGQRTIAPNIDWIENATEGSIFGGGPLYHLKKVLQPKALKVLTKELSEEFWEQAGKAASPAEVGQLFIEAVQNKKLASSRIIKMLYGQVDEVTQGMAQIDLRPVKVIAGQISEQAAKSKGLGSSQGLSRISRRVRSLDDFVNFKTAQEIRSNLLEETRKLEGMLGSKLPKVDRAATSMASQIDDIMEQAAKTHSPEAYSTWRTANAATKKLYTDVLSNQYIEAAAKLAKSRPQDIAKSLFKPNAIKPVQAVKKIVDKKTWDSLVASHVEAMLTPTQGREVIMGRTFLGKLDVLGDDILREMFTVEQLKNVREVGNIAKLVQDPIGRGGGSMVMQLTQAGAIVGTATGLVEGAAPKASAAGILFGPAGLGKLITSPKGAQWLSEGLTTPRWSSNATALAVRIIKAARGVPEIEGPKVPEKPKDWNPFKSFPGPPRLTPKGGIFGTEKEEKHQLQTNLLLKQTR